MPPKNQIVMVDNLLSLQVLIVPRTMTVLEERDIVTEAAGAAASRVDTEFGLVSYDDQAFRAERVKFSRGCPR